MPHELEQLLQRVSDWPPELQDKVANAILAFQAEYIDGNPDDNL
jgi:hypothetical protein